MKKKHQLNKVKFEELLQWFSSDKDEAGEEYEKIRQGLVRYFRFRGCSDPDDLADLTINRVALKLSDLDLTRTNNKLSIFVGFALNIFREYLASQNRKNVKLNNELLFENVNSEKVDNEFEFEKLDDCLEKLLEEDRSLILQYYSEDGAEKIKIRKVLAKNLNISMNALHVRIFRIKNDLKECIENNIKK